MKKISPEERLELEKRLQELREEAAWMNFNFSPRPKSHGDNLEEQYEIELILAADDMEAAATD